MRARRGMCAGLAALLAVGVLVALVAAPTGRARERPTCFGKPATIVGSNGSDRISGTAQKDVIYARGGNDTIKAPSGPENQGRDVICGGPGNDEIVGNGDSEKLVGGPGNDFIKSGNGNNLVVGDNANPSGNEGGSSGRDDLVGGAGPDFIVEDNYAKGGNATNASPDDNIRAGGGDDVVIGDNASLGGDATGGADDRMGGASGDDLVVGDSYTTTGVATGGGNDDNNSGPGQDLAVGDSYTKTGTAGTGGGSAVDELHAADGGDFNATCHPANSCADVFFGDNYRAACAANRSVDAIARVEVIRCVNQNTTGGGPEFNMNPDQGDDFMDGGLPNPDLGGADGDRCSGGKGIDIATSCHGIQGGYETELPFP